MTIRCIRSTLLATVLLAQPLAPPAAAQGQPVMTLDQVESRYRRMNEVHILKCDKNGDQLFTRTEMLCVQGIYQAMYLDNR
jgi:hypothetical protein